MTTFHDNDLAQIAQRGTTVAQVEEQLQHLATGFPYLRLRSAASVGNGILSLNSADEDKYLAQWQEYRAAGTKKIYKFVPASGAASRMFKDLFAFLSADYDTPTTDSEKTFFAGLPQFAFYEALDKCCQEQTGRDIPSLLSAGEYKTIVRHLLLADGLNYGNLPKGLLLFHRYPSAVRTAVEEHLVEAARYASADGVAHLHFTVSHAHLPLFEALISRVVKDYEQEYGVSYDISFSEQAPASDTIAANLDGTPFRNADGTLLFRPGGHGALLGNLSAIEGDVIFIKNIDNVAPEGRAGDTFRYKQVLAGLLVSTQATLFRLVAALETSPTEEVVEEALTFLKEVLCCQNDKIDTLSFAEKKDYALSKLRRPLRVCGVVKNSGEPGGGPFLAYNADGTTSPQIVEAAQIDDSNDEYVRMFHAGTHFNPVDLVVATKDRNGEHYALAQYVDPQTGFIATKSKDGRPLKALELPGLWNGAMSDWNTIFVAVPATTFTPVKTVSALLRAEHQ